MTKFINFTSLSVLSSLLFTLFVGQSLIEQRVRRNPSDAQNNFTLEIQKMHLDENTKIIEKLDNVYVRLSFETDSGQEHVDYYKDQPLNLSRGEEMELKISLPVKPSWVRNDQLNFKIEIKQPKGLLGDNTLIRCSFVSKNLSQFNRHFTCTLPKYHLSDIRSGKTRVSAIQNEKNEVQRPFLTYNLFKGRSSVKALAAK